MCSILLGGTKATSTTVIRIAIAQLIVHGLFMAGFTAGAINIKMHKSVAVEAEITDEIDEKQAIFLDRLLTILAAFQSIPLILAAMLWFGVATEKYYLVRVFIFLKIFETITNVGLSLSVSVSFAVNVSQIYFAILMCVVPIIAGFWLFECVVVVNIFYNNKVRTPNRKLFATQTSSTVSVSTITA